MEENDPYLILHPAKADRNGHLAQSQLSFERRVALIYEFALLSQTKWVNENNEASSPTLQLHTLPCFSISHRFYLHCK